MRALLAFLEDRTGIASAWRASMTDKHPPAGIGWLRTIGFAALTVLAIQLLSGIALAFHYVPSASLAYDSIRAFEQDVAGGAFVRALHHFGASAFVVLAVLHLLRVFFTGAYKAPRELTWLTGLGLLACVLGFGFTGYLLPWDQKAYFATRVGTEIAGKAPIVGATVREILNGGATVGPPTLTRFYVIHVVLLPLALLGVLGLHLFLIQRHGVAPPGRRVGDEGVPGPAYFPHHVLREALAGLLVAVAIFGLAAASRAPLEAMAEPAETGYEPRPDWYFLAAFQLLKLFHGPLELVGVFWLPNLLVLALVLLPFVDRNPERLWRKRPLATTLGVLTVLAIAGLTVAGAADAPRNPRAPRHPLGCDEGEKRGYLALRRLRCLECHECKIDGVVYGERKHKTPELLEAVRDYEAVAFDRVLLDPESELGTEDMPSFDYVDPEDRRALFAFLKRIAGK